MSFAFVLVELVDTDEDASLLYGPELVVDGGAEDEHGGREVHIGVDEGRYVAAALAHLGVEDAVVELEVVLYEELAELRGVVLKEEGMVGADEVAAVAEVLVEEVEDHVARKAVVGGVHGHLAEEVLGIVEHDGEGGEAVEEVVEGEEALGIGTRGLVLDSNEGAAQLEGAGQVVVDEALGEVEHVGGGEDGLSLGIELHVGTVDVAVAADDLLGIGVPDDELLVGYLHRIVLVDVDTQPCAATSGAEGGLAQTPYLLHYVGSVVGIDDVEVVAATVGVAQAALLGELGLEELFADGVYDSFHCRQVLSGGTMCRAVRGVDL